MRRQPVPDEISSSCESGLRDKVIFLGSIPHKELKNYIRASCALLITSYYEGTAKVIKEAAFAGRTTISSDTSGVRDAITNGETGLIVPIDDQYALFNAMNLLLKDHDKALSMGIRAKEFMLKKFDYQKDIDRIVDIWKQAIMIAGNYEAICK